MDSSGWFHRNKQSLCFSYSASLTAELCDRQEVCVCVCVEAHWYIFSSDCVLCSDASLGSNQDHLHLLLY